ncbi:MAG: hypothetical protein N3D18_14975 [Roseococcus sp.]|nr:hypothetical protein [Roseococcus sp.]
MIAPAPAQLRELARAAREASDSQLLRLVAVLDRLPRRGAADAVLDPVRHRLATLRPERPMTPMRLLFLPMEGVIVAPRAWRGEARQLPRTALAPIGEAVFAAAPGLEEALAASIGEARISDHALAATLGARLWPAAAQSLPESAPPGWAETGLPEAAYARLRPLVALLWRHGPGVHALRAVGGDGPPEDLARPVFRALAAEGSEAVQIGLAAVLPAASRPARLVALVAGLDQALGSAAERALDQFLETLTPPAPVNDLGRTTAAARRFAAMVEDLERGTTRDAPRRAQILQGLRQAAAGNCRERLEAETATGLLAPLGEILADPGAGALADDAQVAALEQRARALRGLADAGRRLGGHGAVPGEGLRAAGARLAAALPSLPTSAEGFSRVDALRLLEILEGPEAAAARR